LLWRIVSTDAKGPMSRSTTPLVTSRQADLTAAFLSCRNQTLRLADGLTDADATVQSMQDASPSKWHLAHTTWFFEEFVLLPGVPGYRVFNPHFRFLFNSYYETVGARQPRAQRGLLSRPSLDEVKSYRAHVDDALLHYLVGPVSAAAEDLIELGIAHEEQHQELFLTDILHLFAQNPLRPAYRPGFDVARMHETRAAASWIEFPGGIVEIGHSGSGFGFDCERPAHAVLLRPYALAERPVSNGDWCAFIAAGGYGDPRWWLADGWAAVCAGGWDSPLYWRREADEWLQMTLHGERPIEPEAPVHHISYYEADAFARWSQARLPTEFEWEAAARGQPVRGHFADSAHYRPRPRSAEPDGPLRQLYGGVWEWTASPFLAYPGFQVAPGAVGEYNGKFMCGQFVLRGGSCATPPGHIRPSYRNFFYPGQRWQFSGLRLAEDR